MIKKAITGTCNKSDVIYKSKNSFYKYYRDTKDFDSLSFRSKYSFLAEFSDDIVEFGELKHRNENAKRKKIKVYDTASELYNKFPDKDSDEYYDLEKKKEERKKSWALNLCLLI